MRTHGKVIKWNDERGFGFVCDGPREIFVHISAFPRDGKRPELGELVSYEAEVGPNGKLRALRVMRPGRALGPSPSLNKRSHARAAPSGLFFLVVLAALGAGAYATLKGSAAPVPVEAIPKRDTSAVVTTPSFKCDGRTTCPQMRSCAEAEFFLSNCPNTQMDGNRDGEPCEQQWCR